MSGTILYWEAWLYIIAFSVFEIIQIRFLIRNDPELVKQRLTLRERTATQQRLIWFGGFNYSLMYALPAIDRRYGWSVKPIWLIIAGYVLLGIGWVITYKTFQTNRWAGRTIQVQKDQKVINTGLYGVVRHPLYLGGWVISIGTPLALGSYWGLIASLSWLIMLTMRLLNEEKMLIRDLPDYEAYCRKVKHRLIPGIF